MNGIALSLTPPGNTFVAFQQALLDHYDRGIILAINSRNNPDDAWEVIRTHPNMILKENHFAGHRINWNDKAHNLQELAIELNIGLDAMVFLDDDQTNRELVRALLPEVETPELPADSKDYVKFLNALDYFNFESITDEDKMRGNLYVTERLRKEQEKRFVSTEDFLKSLSLELYFYEDHPSCIPRLAQLTEKTNQFNVDKRAFTESEIATYIEEPDSIVFHGRLLDSFGDYGVIIMAIVDKKPHVWHIHTFLMSCRIFGREVEHAFLSVIIARAQKEGIQRITIAYTESSKNVPARKFVESYFTDNMYETAKLAYVPSWITIHYEKNI